MFGKAERVESFSRIVLRESGMRGTWEYEIVSRDTEAEITFYFYRYTENGKERQADCSKTCSCSEMIELLNMAEVMKWDGFHGKHPKGVLDGIMFGFTAEVNDGRVIKADGSQNFPKGYRDFERRISEILRS